jgi:hypothetical protein
MFNVSVCRDCPEHFNKTIAFEVYDLALGTYFNRANGKVAPVIWVD